MIFLCEVPAAKRSPIQLTFFKLAFYESSFYLKKLKETKNPESYQDKVLEKETVPKAPVIISPQTHRWKPSSVSFRELTLHSFRSGRSMNPKSTCDWFPIFQLSRKSRLRQSLASHISSILLHLPNHIVRTCLKIMLERNSGKAAKNFYSDIKGKSNTDLMMLS